MRTIELNSYTPKLRDYCNTIVVDGDTGTQYIFDSDGVFTTYTSKQQEGATIGIVDAKISAASNKLKKYSNDGDSITLEAAKAYTDMKVPADGASVQYVDQQDASTLQSAKEYTDSKTGGSVGQNYVDQQDAATLQSAKDYADTKDSILYSTVTGDISAATANVPVIIMTDVDPGEGIPLPANHFIAVYQGEESE